MSWGSVGRLIAGIAPVLGDILGGPAEALAAHVGGLIASALGTHSTPESVEDVLRTDPGAYVKIKALELEQATTLARLRADAALAQIRVNQAEAQSGNLFISGARPMIMWVCATAFAWQFVVAPVTIFVGQAMGAKLALPVLDYRALQTVLMGLLGLGGLRTFEKIKGVNQRHG